LGDPNINLDAIEFVKKRVSNILDLSPFCGRTVWILDEFDQLYRHTPPDPEACAASSETTAVVVIMETSSGATTLTVVTDIARSPQR